VEPRRFAYYARLSAKDKRIYRASDEAPDLVLPDAAALQPLVRALEAALVKGTRPAVARATVDLAAGVLRQLRAPGVHIRVREVRPSSGWGELHGLYTFAEKGETPEIELWMRTAAKANVVKFRTYLRTLIHELGHHLDVTVLKLPDSFHTQGFYRRESSLTRQLAGAPVKPARRPAKASAKPAARQLGLFE
jgi:hypothetical protein